MEVDLLTPPIRAALQREPPHQDALWETSAPLIGISLMRFGLQKNVIQALRVLAAVDESCVWLWPLGPEDSQMWFPPGGGSFVPD